MLISRIPWSWRVRTWGMSWSIHQYRSDHLAVWNLFVTIAQQTRITKEVFGEETEQIVFQMISINHRSLIAGIEESFVRTLIETEKENQIVVQISTLGSLILNPKVLLDALKENIAVIPEWHYSFNDYFL